MNSLQDYQSIKVYREDIERVAKYLLPGYDSLMPSLSSNQLITPKQRTNLLCCKYVDFRTVWKSLTFPLNSISTIVGFVLNECIDLSLRDYPCEIIIDRITTDIRKGLEQTINTNPNQINPAFIFESILISIIMILQDEGFNLVNREN